LLLKEASGAGSAAEADDVDGERKTDEGSNEEVGQVFSLLRYRVDEEPDAKANDQTDGADGAVGARILRLEERQAGSPELVSR
jgi:hypothetical protein